MSASHSHVGVVYEARRDDLESQWHEVTEDLYNVLAGLPDWLTRMLYTASPSPATDSATLTALFDLFRQREQLGLAKYGTTVDRTDLTPAQWRQHHREELMDALLYSLAEEREDSFQARVSTWMGQCFLPSLYSNMTERGDRLLEEVLELLQSKGYDRNRVATLVEYVYGRPPGEPSQEVGGVMVTLGGYCWVAGLDMHADGERELARINQPEVMTKIRAKQEAKNALHFDTPLPGAVPEEQL